MFTGLIEDLGTVERIDRSAEGARVWVRTSLPWQDLSLGESISHNGICLTLVQLEPGRYRVEVSEETLRRTTLGGWEAGTRVNLERALAVGSRLGGHWVLGHVDGVGKLLEREQQGFAERLRISFPEPFAPLLIEKGSVAVDGVSLTVNELFRDSFSVTIIPETRARTLLGTYPLGASVNLEGDVIGKYIARLKGLEAPGTPKLEGLTQEALLKAGFE